MIKFCLECGEVYDVGSSFDKSGNIEFCPKASCYGEIIEVDDLMLPTIKILNEKGYYTRYCCSGHYTQNGGDNCYIMFEDEVKFSSLPKGFKYDKGAIKNTIRRNFKSEDYELFKEINLCANELLEWAIGLEEVE